MPAVLTHDFFGKDAYGPAMESVDLITPDQRDAFILGNQGPDPLFYLQILPRGWDSYKALGNAMHHDAPSTLLLCLRQAVDAMPEEDRSVAQAYAAGFVCHYLLDSAVHPLVYFWQFGVTDAGVPELDSSDGGIVHAEIERDLDEMVLWHKMHQTVETYRPYEHVLQARPETLDLIGRLYAKTDFSVMANGADDAPRVFPEAVRCFRLTQRAFYLSGDGQAKAWLFSTAERRVLHNRYSLYLAMAHRVRRAETSSFDNHEHLGWRNPFTDEVSTTSFWDIYRGALGRVRTMLPAFFGDGFEVQAAHELTGGLNFSGEPTD